jgi:hypothetical protein
VRNLDKEPGFWLTDLMLIPLIIAVEILLLFEKDDLRVSKDRDA